MSKVNTPKPVKTVLERKVESLEEEVAKLNRENINIKKMATTAIRDCTKLKIEIQRMTTRMISNENDVRNLGPKR